MIRSRSWACHAASMLVMSAALAPAPLDAATPVRGSVAFSVPRVSPNGLARLPTILPRGTISAAVANRINGALRRLDARGLAAAAECRADAREASRPQAGGWQRKVEVTMAGPRYFSVTVSDSSYCGGPYPNDDLQSAFVYDVETGRPVDWLSLFPVGAKALDGSALDGTATGLVTWRELSRRAAAQATRSCRDMFGERALGFAVRLDGRSGALVARPADLPHAIQACARDVRLDVPALRRLGFDPRLIAALDAAGRMQGPRSARSTPSKI